MVAPVWATNDVPTATDFNEWLTNVHFVRKTVNESVTSSTAFQNDDDLVLPVLASSVYELDMVVRTDGDPAGDIKLQWSVPSGTVVGSVAHGLVSTGAGGADDQVADFDDGDTPVFGTTGAGAIRNIHIKGLVIVSTTAGNFQLQWAQNASNATATRVLTRSFMSLRRVS